MKMKVTVNCANGSTGHDTPPAMRAPVSVTIEGLDHNGVARGTDARGRAWTVRGAPLGATVRAAGRRNAGVMLAVEAYPPDAVPPRCAQHETCGGCTLQHAPLARQRTAKAAMLAELLAPLGGIDHGLEAVPDHDGYGYRNKVELTFGTRRYLRADELNTDVPLTGRFLGMHAAGRYDRIADAPRCELASAAMNAVVARVREDVLHSAWEPWDAHAHQGTFRHLVLREGAEGVLAAIHTSHAEPELAQWLRARAPTWGAAGVQWWVNAGLADAALGHLHAQLHGCATVTQRLGVARFRLSASAFFQVHDAAAQLLVTRVGDALALDRGAARDDVLLDLYCGTGALGLALADRVGRVIGVELNEHAVADARTNAAENGVDATYHAGPCEQVVPTLDLPGAPAVIVDPPRVGLHPDALRFVCGLDARVLVYVACKPSSLLRDGLALAAAGWRCTDRWAVDLFPQTGHAEVVARFTRAV
ncbi:MAG: hypothetical protein RLZZ299_2820 [Pseudomonadota bacterium]|jgi:23S rRNA (uracil1939-C5)-methyltransferase